MSIDPNVPYALRDKAEQSRREALLSQPHIAPLAAYLSKIRSDRGEATGIPWFDPCDGGVDARALFLAEAPGPRAVPNTSRSPVILGLRQSPYTAKVEKGGFFLLLSPAMVRWPGKIPAGRVSDEIFADLDWYPTIANIIGESKRIPTDRPIDGIDQTDFLLGKQEKSNRDFFMSFVGTDLYAIKWRNMKIHFMTSAGTHAVLQKYTFPQVYDIKNDPAEMYELWANEGYSHTWIMEPVSKIIAEVMGSMAKYRNIKPGEEFKGYQD